MPPDLPLRLEIELVPPDAWNRSLRAQVRRSVWDKLRRQAYAEAKDCCSICGQPGKLHCHEVWSYDDERHIQTLIALSAVCNMCHYVTHYGMARILASQGHLDLEAVDAHFRRVNKASAARLKSHQAAAIALCLKRSVAKWTIDFGNWQPLFDSERANRGDDLPRS